MFPPKPGSSINANVAQAGAGLDRGVSSINARPTLLPPAPGPKRSGHVALLVMGTLAVGGTAYALMPGETCQPPSDDPRLALLV